MGRLLEGDIGAGPERIHLGLWCLLSISASTEVPRISILWPSGCYYCSRFLLPLNSQICDAAASTQGQTPGPHRVSQFGDSAHNSSLSR